MTSVRASEDSDPGVTVMDGSKPRLLRSSLAIKSLEKRWGEGGLGANLTECLLPGCHTRCAGLYNGPRSHTRNGDANKPVHAALQIRFRFIAAQVMSLAIRLGAGKECFHCHLTLACMIQRKAPPGCRTSGKKRKTAPSS